MRNQTAVKARAVDIQESLKILQFRFGRKVGFRPVVMRRGVRYYPVEGRPHAEPEILSWTEAAQWSTSPAPALRPGPTSQPKK